MNTSGLTIVAWNLSSDGWLNTVCTCIYELIPTIIPKSNSSYSSKIFRDRQKKLLNFMTNHIEELHTLIYNNNIISTKVINDYINEYINEKIYILSQR